MESCDRLFVHDGGGDAVLGLAQSLALLPPRGWPWPFHFQDCRTKLRPQPNTRSEIGESADPLLAMMRCAVDMLPRPGLT